MKIQTLILGAYQTNCYILRQVEDAKDCLLVDTGLEDDKLIDFLIEYQLNPVALVLTHGHADHIGALPVLRSKFPEIKIYVHKLDAEMLTKPTANLSMLTGKSIKTTPADFLVEDKDIIEQAGIKLQVLHTPGHSPGGISLYSKENAVIFVGDALFADSVGRTDFPGGSMTQLIKGIKEKLCVLPDETIVYPGHGPATTIAQEKNNNPYLQ